MRAAQVGAVNRVLGRVTSKRGNPLPVAITALLWHACMTEVTKADIDMEEHKVQVESSLYSDEILAVLKKTGRECLYIGTK